MGIKRSKIASGDAGKEEDSIAEKKKKKSKDLISVLGKSGRRNYKRK